MNPYTIQAADIKALQAEMGADCPTFTWGLLPYAVIPGTAHLNKPLREGGFSQMFDLTLTATVDQFISTKIADAASLINQLLNSPISYGGLAYKVSNVHLLSGSTIIRIEANSINQKA